MRWFAEHRRVVTFVVGAVIFGLGIWALQFAGPQGDRAHAEETGQDEAAEEDLYAVPDTDDAAELLQFIEKVRNDRPPRPRGPAEYRAYVKYQKGAPPAIAEAAKKILSLTKDTKSDNYADASAYLLETKVMGFADADAEGRKAILGDVTEHLKKFGVRRDEAGVAYGISQAIERDDPKLAAKAYAELGELVAKSEDEEISKLAESLFQGPARRLGLVGSKMNVFGTTLDGEEFDWKKYKGKVVLVDFWATWCGPCLAELPNLKEAYEKYHDKGFEVIGVNLDQRRFALDRFLEKEPLPWPQLHQEEEGNGMAEYYGVNAIPFIALVGRDGKVITIEARGRALHQHLEEIFGPEKGASGESGE